MTRGAVQTKLLVEVFSFWTLIKVWFFIEKKVCAPLRGFLQVQRIKKCLVTKIVTLKNMGNALNLFLPEATPDCVSSRTIHEAEKLSISLQKYIIKKTNQLEWDAVFLLFSKQAVCCKMENCSEPKKWEVLCLKVKQPWNVIPWW